MIYCYVGSGDWSWKEQAEMVKWTRVGLINIKVYFTQSVGCIE